MLSNNDIYGGVAIIKLSLMPTLNARDNITRPNRCY